MNPELESVLAGTAGLSTLLVVSTLLTLSRPRVSSSSGAIARLTWFAGLAIAAQALHFDEELVTRFYQRFPALLGLAPWSSTFFVAFNVFWLVVWIVSVRGVRSGRVAALLPLWFLGLALVLNGIVHPLLALRARGYFPGLITSPLLLIAGLALLNQLSRVTKQEVPAA